RREAAARGSSQDRRHLSRLHSRHARRRAPESDPRWRHQRGAGRHLRNLHREEDRREGGFEASRRRFARHEDHAMTTATLTPGNLPSRIVTAVVVAALMAAGVVGFFYAFDDASAHWPQVVPPAQDAMTQSLDLNSIADFRYVNDSYVEVTDELGHRFAMKFTA